MTTSHETAELAALAAQENLSQRWLLSGAPASVRGTRLRLGHPPPSGALASIRGTHLCPGHPPLNSSPVPARCWRVPSTDSTHRAQLSELLSPSALMGTQVW